MSALSAKLSNGVDQAGTDLTAGMVETGGGATATAGFCCSICDDTAGAAAGSGSGPPAAKVDKLLIRRRVLSPYLLHHTALRSFILRVS